MNSLSNNKDNILSFSHIDNLYKILFIVIPLSYLPAVLGLTEIIDIISVLFFGLLLSIIKVILFLYWYYKAYHNLYAFNAKGLSYSPRMAVVWWFIPIINLWKPFTAFKEIWKVSSTNRDLINGNEWKDVPYPDMLTLFWILYILTFITILISIEYLGLIISVVFAGFTLYIIKKITTYQETKFSKIVNNMK